MRFEYTALDAQGRLVQGAHEASSRAASCAQLEARGLDLLQLRLCWREFLKRGVQALTTHEWIGFCQHLAHYLAGGLHLGEALQDLAEHAETPALRTLGQNLQAALQGGLSLSQALRPQLAARNAYVAELIAAGELSGTLPTLLQRLADTLQRSDNWRQQTRKALLYPCIAGTVAGAACLFLLLFLVPQIESFLGASGQPLPWYSRLLFAFSAGVQQAWPYLLCLPPVLFAVLVLVLRAYPQFYGQMARWQLRLPLVGRVRQQLQLAQLAELLGLLYAAGIPLAEALGSCAASCRNLALAESLEEIHERVQTGMSLSQAFARAEAAPWLYPAFFLQLLRGGEQAGQLEHSLYYLSARYDALASAAIARLNTLIEPALTLVVGLFLGWVVVATLQPLYALIGKAL